MTQTNPELDGLDRIERSIDIDASAERVWELVARPGWWINEDEVDPEPTIRHEGDVAVLVHEKFGEFRIRTEESDEPRYLRYRWIEPDDNDAGTSVEFFLDESPSGGVTLRVVESGLTGLGKDREALERHYRGNSEGWEKELAAAQRFVTRTTT